MSMCGWKMCIVQQNKLVPVYSAAVSGQVSSFRHVDLPLGVSWWNMLGLPVRLLNPTLACPSSSGNLQWQTAWWWLLCPFVGRLILEQSSKHNTHLTTMRCPFLLLYATGSCPVLKFTALSLPAWISILMLGIIANTHSIFVWSTNQPL